QHSPVSLGAPNQRFAAGVQDIDAQLVHFSGSSLAHGACLDRELSLVTRRLTIRSGLLLPEEIAFPDATGGCFNAADTSPARSASRLETAHPVFSVVNSAAVAESHFRHCNLPLDQRTQECQNGR
ncbi:MAG TPA: hypothetical protein VF096_13730, partial [Azonexus sp.]